MHVVIFPNNFSKGNMRHFSSNFNTSFASHFILFGQVFFMGQMKELEVMKSHSKVTLKMIMLNVNKGVVELFSTHVILNLYIECTPQVMDLVSWTPTTTCCSTPCIQDYLVHNLVPLPSATMLSPPHIWKSKKMKH